MSVYRPEEWGELLDRNYHHLCRSVRPEAFFSWLRSQGVFSRDDQEEVENKYVTTVMKTGHLIDTVKRKGKKAFQAFMEVVEYVYPDTYNVLTGKQPRNPPPDFEPSASIGGSVIRERRGQALSSEILGQMGDLVNVLSQANAYKKEELAKLQTYVRQLQKENQGMCDEKRSFLLKYKDAQEEIEDLKQKIDVLNVKHEHDSKERQAVVEDCEKLRQLKDKYMEESRQLRQDRDDLDCRMLQITERELHRSLTCRLPPGQLEQIREENRQLLLERDKLKAKLNECGCQQMAAMSLRIEPLTLEQRIQEMEMTVSEWQNKHSLLQERYDHVLVNLTEVQAERNQMHHRLEDLQKMYNKEAEENKRLEADCEKYRNKFCDMEAQMTSLYKEIDQRLTMHSSPSTSKEAGHDLCTDLANGDLPVHGCASPEGEDESSPATKFKTGSDTDISKTDGRQYIESTPGLCPNIKRQLVIHKPLAKTKALCTD